MKATITKALAAAFSGPLADAVTSFTHTTYSAAGPATPFGPGEVTSRTTEGHRGVFRDYTVRELAADGIERGDVLLVALQAEAPAFVSGDVVVAEGWGTYAVVSAGQDPAHATWQCQLRSTGVSV